MLSLTAVKHSKAAQMVESGSSLVRSHARVIFVPCQPRGAAAIGRWLPPPPRCKRRRARRPASSEGYSDATEPALPTHNGVKLLSAGDSMLSR